MTDLTLRWIRLNKNQVEAYAYGSKYTVEKEELPYAAKVNGVEIGRATSGKEAFKICQQHFVDIINKR